MRNDLSKELLETKNELLKVLNAFSDGVINIVPFEGNWTPGQVAEHILISASGVSSALKGEAKTAFRDPEQHIKLLGDVFLNFDVKMKSPDFVLPTNKGKDKQELIMALTNTFDELVKTADSDDLNQICVTFEMPTLGTLSKKELLYFVLVHTRRHIHQLKNIANHPISETIN
jgi:hypothetical protein